MFTSRRTRLSRRAHIARHAGFLVAKVVKKVVQAHSGINDILHHQDILAMNGASKSLVIFTLSIPLVPKWEAILNSRASGREIWRIRSPMKHRTPLRTPTSTGYAPA